MTMNPTRTPKTTQQFIAEAVAKHGNKYDYGSVKYKTAKDKVIIVCGTHGAFLKSPGHHLAGQGCPKCSSTHSRETKEKMSTTWKRKRASGEGQRPFTREDIQKGLDALKTLTEEQKKERAKAAGDTMRDVPQPMDGLTGKHEWNCHGKYWHFVNKGLGAELKGWNLNQLIRDNEHLFDKKYLNWGRSGCNAAICLRQLTSKKTEKTRPRNSWLGWVIG